MVAERTCESADRHSILLWFVDDNADGLCEAVLVDLLIVAHRR
jgi:hypothetical protein